MAKPAVKPIPDGMHSLTPHLVCAGAADAIEFYKKAFNAVSTLMLVDENPQWWLLGPIALKGSPVTVHLYVDDVDGVVAKAVAAGARITMPIADMFWGDRYGQLEDPFGHRWSVATHTRDLSPSEIQEGMAKMGA